ncbi:NSS family neurotransmitter:Na+ symporter [Pullulanibacillus pueri]|uniref:Transporter n=1 Tax=Pullulanibacillus pueri TaxID=1437324 RepID=A0A8J2ZUD7_9BACL|nr:sodium-dependent transporter [Pullulanibacillus pueri]MBM7680781.1 NSS family neurotransmitter:Na+ symporter [Pullulanibacillus pueri]GGH78311.1 transporter [Pullulanibacillus pueri]
MKEQWSSKLGFILSSAGAAIGLGAIWKFPYVTGMSGGGAFFLLFIIFTLLIGLPLLISEFIIGRGSGKEAISAYQALAPKSLWTMIGRLGVLGCFLLLSFYSVVGGWVLIYSVLSIPGLVITGDRDYSALFTHVTASPSIVLLGLALFLIINVIVISFGIQRGIEKVNKILMPLLFLFFLILVIRSLTLGHAYEGIRFFLKPNFSNMTGQGVLYALGQSFFSLAVGFSCMVTYSSYLGKKVSLPTSAATVGIMNIFVSLLAGLAIFPVVFSFGLEPTAGPGLLFIVLPTVFAQMPFGEVFLCLFLLLFLFATLTSSFSLLEVIVSAFTEGKQRSRRKVTLISGIIMFIAGIPAALSQGSLKHLHFFGKTAFDSTDFLVSNLLLPIGCFFIALFIIHRMDHKRVKDEFMEGHALSQGWFSVWYFIMKWVVPIVIILVFLSTLGLF